MNASQMRLRTVLAGLCCGALALGTAGCLGAVTADPRTADCDGAARDPDAPLVAVLAQDGSAQLGLGETGDEAIDRVIESATVSGARMMLTGAGAGRADSAGVDTRLSGEGNNGLEREASLRCRTELVRDSYQRIASRPLSTRLDLISALRDLSASLPTRSGQTLDLVLLGSALNTEEVNLRRPAARRGPARSINRLARSGLNFGCSGWRVHMVGAGSARGGAIDQAAASQLREWWRRYFRHCGGALVLFAPRLSEFPADAAEVAPADRSLIPLDLEQRKDSVRATLSGDLLFAVGSATLQRDAGRTLRRLMPAIAASRGTIDVAGHTDSTGPVSVNRLLSRARAWTVGRWLIRFADVPPARLRVHGYGRAKPVASNSTALGRAKNRRVVVTVRRR